MKYTLYYHFRRLRSSKYDTYTYYALTKKGAIRKAKRHVKHAENKFGGKWSIITICNDKTGITVYRTKKS